MSFDVDQYAQTSTRIRWDDLDMSSFETTPLSEDALRCLSYMSDVETHTVCYLRDLLVTPSHADPEVTVFLTMWNLEEYWHGEVLDEVLERHGLPTGPNRTRAVRTRLGWKDRLAPNNAKIDSLPGQRNLHLVENQLRKYGVLGA